LFQTLGAATENRRLPNIVLQWGTVSSSCDDERRQRCGWYTWKKWVLYSRDALPPTQPTASKH